MKDVRPEFTDEEFNLLRTEASQRHISLKKLVHDRAVDCSCADSSLHEVQVLATEMAQIRGCMNQIIRRETGAEIRLYEDDVIRLERRMTELEHIVAEFVADILRREVRNDGKPAVYTSTNTH